MPKEDPNHIKVRELAALGLPDEDIAGALSISTTNLHRKYKKAIDLGKQDTRIELARTLYAMATDPEEPSISAIKILSEKVFEGKAPPSGKKGQQQEAAKTAAKTGPFKTSGPPKLVVNNK